jgi:pimeloyl-ACP methyl ester carboxylesterase
MAYTKASHDGNGRLTGRLVRVVADLQVPASNSERIASMVGAELVLLDDCGHVPFEECPDRFMSALEDFLQKQGSKLVW